MTAGRPCPVHGSCRGCAVARKAEVQAAQEAQCDNCPFANSGPGLHLRQQLRPGRFREVQMAVLIGQPFWCHKTTDWERLDDEDADEYVATGKERHCGGALAFRRRLLDGRQAAGQRADRAARKGKGR